MYVPHFKRTVKPKNPARVINGKIVRPMDGPDWVMFGLAACVAPISSIYQEKK
jgi:hypothetical protein